MKTLLTLNSLLWILTGIATIALGNYPDSSVTAIIKPLHNVVYAFFLFSSMLFGIAANQYWEQVVADKNSLDLDPKKAFAPIFITPMIFLPLWSMIEGPDGLAEINMTWAFVAFQNGFFWQVVFNRLRQ